MLQPFEITTGNKDKVRCGGTWTSWLSVLVLGSSNLGFKL